MTNIHCLTHRRYRGDDLPPINCRPCCEIWVATGKRRLGEFLVKTKLPQANA